jgi:signal transduction histidine kinase
MHIQEVRLSLTAQMHLMAGLGALGLGLGALLAEPRRRRNRLFALLCGTLVIWSIGVALWRGDYLPGFPWYRVYLIGSCFAAPAGLHFFLDLVGRTASRRWMLRLAYAVATGLYISAWTPAYHHKPGWNIAAMFALSPVFLMALISIRQLLHERQGRYERNAYRLLLAGSILAVIGGLSDFLPRAGRAIPRIGPLTILILLVIICALVIRHRFLDVHSFLARTLALVTGAAVASLLFYAVVSFTDGAILPIFLTTIIILLIAGPGARFFLSGARIVLGRRDALSNALVDLSQKLPTARDASDVWRSIGEGLRPLEGDSRVAIYLTRPDDALFRPAYQTGSGQGPPPIDCNDPLPQLLEQERAPITRLLVEERGRDALDQFNQLDVELLVPLCRDGRLAGWIGVGGGFPDRYLRSEIAAALVAVGNQVVASLERLQAIEEARRREALAAVGEMAAGLAHEVRNPLGAIQGAAQVLVSETDPIRTHDMLEVIQEETSRLGRVVGDFLDYARAGGRRREPIDLADLARRALRSSEAAGEGLRGEVRVAPGTPHASGDPDQMQRAIGNIVRNAREAAGEGGCLTIDVAGEGADRVSIRFEDDGPGIASDVVPRLFQPFFTTRSCGTGLGLALVHRVIEAQGGEVRVEGRPGSGAVFTLVLPALADDGPRGAES